MTAEQDRVSSYIAVYEKEHLAALLVATESELKAAQEEIHRLREGWDGWQRQCLAAEEREKTLREAGEALATVLQSTLYSPPGFSGPPVWWDNQARTAIKLFRAAQRTEEPSDAQR